MARHRLFNPWGVWQSRRQSQQQSQRQAIAPPFNQNLNTHAIGLPSAATWTQYVTRILLFSVSAGIVWSVTARVDVVINGRGKLEPASQAQIIQSRTGGIVTAVLVREGQAVKQGQLLMQFDKTSLYNQLQNLSLQRDRLAKEIAVLRVAKQGKTISSLGSHHADLAPELLSQVQRRLLLVAQITGNSEGLDPSQQQRYELFQQQLRDRQTLNHLQESSLEAQAGEVLAQIDQTQFQLQTEQELMDNLQPLVAAGAIPRVTLLQRQVGVSDLKNKLTQSALQKQQVELSQLRTQVESGQTLTTVTQDLQRQLAELDNQFDATIKTNQAQLIDINAKLKQVQLDLKGQDLRASTDGIVFDLGPKLPGGVSQAGQTLLKIVPNESLTAQIQVANADIANIRIGMPVDVRIDAYPFTEFGAVKGTVLKVSHEAIQSANGNTSGNTGANPGASVFPVEVKLEHQFLSRRAQPLPLTPGMSVTTLIKIRQRAPISYVTEEITKVFDGMKSVR